MEYLRGLSEVASIRDWATHFIQRLISEELHGRSPEAICT